MDLRAKGRLITVYQPKGQDQNFILMIYDGSDKHFQINVALLEPVVAPIAF